MAESPRISGTWRRAAAFATVVVTLAVGVLAGTGRMILIAPLHVPLDPNEGWNAYHAAAAMAGNPYPPAGSFLVNNYPPLSFYFVGLVGLWLGDNVVAGRIVSLAAFVALCSFTAIALRRMGVVWSAAVFAALLLAATLLLTSDYVGMDDPQLLGHALQLAGLLLLLRRSHRMAIVLVSAVLFAAGIFVKHNLVALPLASIAWLTLFDRQKAIRFAAALACLSIAGLIATDLLLSVSLFQLLNSPRTFFAANLTRSFFGWIPYLFVPLCTLVWLLLRFGQDRAVRLVSLYVMVSVLLGTAVSGGAGVDVNAMFDADIALAFCTALALSSLLVSGSSALRAAALIFAILAIAPLATTALRSPEWRDPSFWLNPMREDVVTTGRDIRFLRTHPGPAMCEDLTFCYWSGKPASVDVFNLDQQFETGARDPAAFRQLLQSRYFATIELDEIVPFPFPAQVKEAILRNYRIDHQDDEGIFFIARQ